MITKKQRHRSPRYARTPLIKLVPILDRINTAYGANPIDRASIVKLLDRKFSGSSMTLLATLTHYGLINTHGVGKIYLSSRGQQLVLEKPYSGPWYEAVMASIQHAFADGDFIEASISEAELRRLGFGEKALKEYLEVRKANLALLQQRQTLDLNRMISDGAPETRTYAWQLGPGIVAELKVTRAPNAKELSLLHRHIGLWLEAMEAS